MIDEKRKTISLILVAGLSGSGKTTISRRYCEMFAVKNPQALVVSYTTRPMRPGEIDGLDHQFVSESDKLAKQTDMVAYTKIGSYEYWVNLEDLRRAKVYVIDPIGIDDLKQQCALRGYHTNFVVVYLYINEVTRHQRLLDRGDSPSQIQKRYEAEISEFQPFIDGHQYDVRVMNVGSPTQVCNQMHHLVEVAESRKKGRR